MRHLVFYPLAWLSDRTLADSIVGDLEEMRVARATGSSLRASLWFWRTALAIVVHMIAARIRQAAKTLAGSRGGLQGAGGDFSHAVRTLRRRPGFALCAILLLTLGIGANTVVFSILHSVVLRPLPYANPERLVYVWGGTTTVAGNRHHILTGAHVQEIGRLHSSFESYAVVKPWDTTIEGVVDLIREDKTHRLRGAFVTPNTFELLGVTAAVGRAFSSTGDDKAAPLAVISAGLWKRLFAMDPRVVGSPLKLAFGRKARGQPPYVVVGVLPEAVRFTYPRDTEIFLLMPWTEIRSSRALEYTMLARLRPGVAAGQAEAEATTLLHNVVRGYPNIPAERLPAVLADTRAMVEPMHRHVSAEVRPGITLLAGVGGLVLLIACINLGLLMLASTVDRSSELAVRAALGAGARRILQLLTVEAIVLSAIGGSLGLALAASLMPLVRGLLPAIVPRADQITLDAPVLIVAAILTIAATLVCGVAPGVVAIRKDLLSAVRRSGIAATGTRAEVAWRSGIVAIQVAAVVVLLVGAGLLLHSFWRLQQVRLGFDADDVLTLETRLYNPKYRERGRIAAFEAALLAHVRGLPGVERASITTAVPMRGVDFTYVIGPVKGAPKPGNMRSVDADYFSILNIPLRAGRLFDARDHSGAAPVMVVSESYARLHFGTASPLGRLMEIGGNAADIVGVVGDVRYAEVVRDAAPAFYLPRTQSPSELICLVVKPRSGMDTAVAEKLREAVRTVDPEQPMEGLTTIGEIVSSSTADRRLYALLSGAFAAVALLLALAGLFGVVSRSVTERRRELAIRAALGADARKLIQVVLASGLVPAAAGAVAGLAGALASGRTLTSLLFEVTPIDPMTYGAAAALVLGFAVAACVPPAVRAVRMQPMAALKSD